MENQFDYSVLLNKGRRRPSPKLFAPPPSTKRSLKEAPKQTSTISISSTFDETFVTLFRKQLEIEQSQEEMAIREKQKLFQSLKEMGFCFCSPFSLLIEITMYNQSSCFHCSF